MHNSKYDLIELSDSDNEQNNQIEDSPHINKIKIPAKVKKAKAKQHKSSFTFTHFEIVQILGLSELQSKTLRDANIKPGYEFTDLTLLLALTPNQVVILETILSQIP